MTWKKKGILLLICLGIIHTVPAQQQGTVSGQDLQRLTGSWQGTLTYLDYTSGKPYTMAADISIVQIGSTGSYSFANSYPKEPNANSTDTMTISADGKRINDEAVTSRQTLRNGNLVIITLQSGVDGNAHQPALIRHTYTIGKEIYSNVKEVQFTGTTAWIKRHEYSYRRK